MPAAAVAVGRTAAGAVAVASGSCGGGWTVLLGWTGIVASAVGLACVGVRGKVGSVYAATAGAVDATWAYAGGAGGEACCCARAVYSANSTRIDSERRSFFALSTMS